MSSWQGKELSSALQGFMINNELTAITSAFARATELWAKGKPYKPQTALVPQAVWYLGGCATGHSRLAVVVCISQSPQNGWETWFSCTWGNNVAKLRAPCHKQKPANLTKETAKAAKAAAKAADALAKADPNSVSAQKFALYRVGQAAYTEQRHGYLQQLITMAKESGVVAAGGASGITGRLGRFRRLLQVVRVRKKVSPSSEYLYATE